MFSNYLQKSGSMVWFSDPANVNFQKDQIGHKISLF